MTERYFTRASFNFLDKLDANNDREWFNDHKQQYEDTIRTPALQFVADMADELPEISPHFRAVSKKVGGSLMRVYRDVRFSKDKRPYKTHVGIQFRHEMGKDVHAPGFYLHIERNNCFIGVGIWRPDSSSLSMIRDYIVNKENTWLAASREKIFLKNFELSGESLINAPRGYDKEHPLIEDLKRKDFIAICPISEKTITSEKLMKEVVDRFKIASDYIEFLCKALELRY